ncbi:hypothetical protein GCM10010972_25030 [Cellulomonas carbonis]|nr:hypothetical protein GCM10010972_25030 [Cellulomonas carbonis]
MTRGDRGRRTSAEQGRDRGSAPDPTSAARVDERVLPDDAVTISVDGARYVMVLPAKETDHIQRTIATTGSPYEHTMLADMATRLTAGDVVVDVGANIGNHSMYLAAVVGCVVEAFEPDAALTSALKKSVQLSDLAGSVRVHTVALGSAAGRGTIVTPDPANIGGQHVDVGSGDVEVVRLDDADVARPVRAVKIDVEGMELEVLRGAAATIEADRPLVYVECAGEAGFGELAEWLDARGYVYWDTFNATPTHVFLPSERTTPEHVSRRLLLKSARDAFRATEAINALRARLGDANLKYRAATQAHERLREDRDALRLREAELRAVVESLEERIDALGEELRKAQDDAGALERRRIAAEERLDAALAAGSATQADLTAAREQIVALASRAEVAEVTSAAREAEIHDAKREVERQRRRHTSLQSKVSEARLQLRAETARVMELREAVAAAERELDAERRVASEAAGEARALRHAVESAHAQVAGAAERLAVEELEARTHASSARSAWAEAGELASALTTHRAAADAREAELVARLQELERDVADAGSRERRLEAEVLEARIAVETAKRHEDAARAEVRRIRQSVTFRAGRELRRARTSPAAALALPTTLRRLAREAEVSEVTSAGTPAELQAGAALADPSAHDARGVLATDAHASDGRGGADVTSSTLTADGRHSAELAASATGPAAEDPPTVRRGLRVAAIVDEFTGLSLEPECDLVHLTPDDWRTRLEEQRPDLLFVESAWRGKDGSWHNTVGQFPSALRDIVEWCSARGVPTAFWNKEDPVHFSTFLTTARAFDHVFTTDLDCIGRYKAALGHDRVHLLPFAAQPRTHNPLEEMPRQDAISFAGSYYRRYPERTRDLDSFLEHLPGFRPVEIFDRNFGSDDPNYSFPEAYQRYVVGTLPPEEIARAYKGYRYAINLNSVKQSQTMFARRVFELLASNTVTVSNFSRGLRLLFGDLVVTTDSGREAVRRLSEIAESPERLDRLRLLALRSVMSQHTYADRLAYVAAKLKATPVPGALPVVTFVGHARTQDEVDALVTAAQRQEGLRHRIVLVVDAGLERPVIPGATVVRADAAHDVVVGDIADDGLVGVLHPDDYYGPHYAFDLVLATRYCDADVLGKRTRYAACDAEGDAAADQVMLLDVGAEYRRVGRLPLRASLVRVTALSSMTLGALCEAADRDDVHAAGLDQVSLDRFSYCRGGASSGTVREAEADDGTCWTGLPLGELNTYAEAAPPVPMPGEGLPSLDADRLAELFHASQRPALRPERTTEGWALRSELEDGQHDYIYSQDLVPVGDLWPGPDAEAYLDTTPGLRVQVVFLFFDADSQRLGTFFAVSQQNASAAVPEGTVAVKIGFRALGPGTTTVRQLVLGRVSTEANQIAATSRDLVLTNHYPSYDNLYRNGFVHSRVRAYRERGVKTSVFRLRPGAVLTYSEFEGVDVASGSQDALRKVLSGAAHRSVMVHFLEPAMWEVLAEVDPAVRVVVWIHGAEVQPWWRRSYNYTDDAELEVAKVASDARLRFWREVFMTAPPNVHFVFVSRYFADEVMDDVGIQLDRDRYSIIHNPIDIDIFTYVPKPREQRMRILSIRPFASAKYANDLTVKAVQELRGEDWFQELEFRIIGDGALFDETLAPVADLPNVCIERRFLTQSEIADLHKEYGVFIVPTRMDAQGVSRDEAMASGLVPITNAVAAIPEFVDEQCGFLAEADDHRGLASAIRTLRSDPAAFDRLSRNAADRVRRQSSTGLVIERELSLILEEGSVSDG